MTITSDVRSKLAGRGSPRQAKPILVVLHQAHSSTGRVGRLLKALGFPLDARYPALGDALPATLEDHQAVVVFGGPMCANDGDEWLRKETDWLKTPLREGKPFLGLCLGAQLMARQLGAQVFSSPSRQGELGYHPLLPEPGADEWCGAAFPRYAYQWHTDGFELPYGAVRIARGMGEFPHQAFVYGSNVVGLQFHPEVTYQMICRWTTRGAARLTSSGSRPHEHRQGWFEHDRALDVWTAAFVKRWASDRLPRLDTGASAPAQYAMAAE